MGRAGQYQELYFIANDPGGFDAVFPVYKKFENDGEFAVKISLTGAAAIIYPKYAKEEAIILEELSALANAKSFLLITGTSWNSDVEKKAIKLCKSKRIATVSILDYWSNYKSRFRLGDEYVFPDHLLVMDELAKNEAVEDGIPEDIIDITGNPGLDKYVSKQIKCEGEDAIFLSQPLSKLYGDSLGYTEMTVLEDVIRVTEDLGIKLDVKFHPKESKEMLIKYGIYSVNYELEEICKKYKYIIGMSTMVLLKCALMGRECISYQPNLIAEDMCATNKLGITSCISSFNRLKEELLNRENNNESMILDEWVMKRGATKRVVARIKEIKYAK